MKAFGLFGARIPEEHGGLGLDMLTYARLMEELAYGWMSLAGVLNTHTIAPTSSTGSAPTSSRRGGCRRWRPASGGRRSR